MNIPIRIAVIEDDSILSRLYTAVFEHESVSTLALSGEEDIVMECDKFKPDLVLLDLNLKNITGFDIIKKLKTNDKTRHIPVVFLSSDFSPEVVAQSYYLGAIDFIEKTPNILELVKHLKTVAVLENMSSGLRRVRELIDKFD